MYTHIYYMDSILLLLSLLLLMLSLEVKYALNRSMYLCLYMKSFSTTTSTLQMILHKTEGWNLSRNRCFLCQFSSGVSKPGELIHPLGLFQGSKLPWSGLIQRLLQNRPRESTSPAAGGQVTARFCLRAATLSRWRPCGSKKVVACGCGFLKWGHLCWWVHLWQSEYWSCISFLEQAAVFQLRFWKFRFIPSFANHGHLFA